MKNLNCSRFSTIAIWSLIIGFTSLYLSLIFNHNIWTDEAFTLQLLKGNIHDIIIGTANDVHPPFYYLYAKLFTFFSEDTLLIQKIASIIPMTATLIIGAISIRSNFGDKAALLFLLFLACIPCTMEFAVQVRMYSLALFLVTSCGICAYQSFMTERKRDFLLFAISGLLAAYTHYFAFVSTIFIAGGLLAAILMCKRKLLTKWLISAGGMIIGYLPWVPYFVKQVINVEQGYWIPKITGQTVWEFFLWTFDLELVPGVVFIFILILKGTSIYNILSIAAHKKAIEIYALLCMLIPTLTTIFGVIVSEFKTPIYRDQYVLPALGLLAIFFGIALRKAKNSILILISLFLLFVGAIQYKECFRQEYRSTYVPQTEQFFADNLEEDDYIIYNWEAFGFIYECYFSTEQLVYSQNFDFSQDFRIIWFLHTEGMPEIAPEVLEENGLAMDHMGHYGIEHNEFDIYKICRITSS